MDSFTCLSLNVNGLRNKLSPTVRDWFQTSDVIALCESKLDKSVADSTLILGKYALFRRDRTSHGGGVVCLVRSELQPKRIFPDPEGSEILMIYLEKISVLIAVVYRPPRTEDNEKTLSSILNCISDIAAKHDRLIITGDFNFPDYPIARSSKSRLGRFLKTCDKLGLKQWVSSPTRGAHILDLFLTKNLSSDVQVADDASLFKSDHRPIEAVVSVAHVLYNN